MIIRVEGNSIPSKKSPISVCIFDDNVTCFCVCRRIWGGVEAATTVWTTQTPAQTQRTLPLAAVWVSTCYSHTVRAPPTQHCSLNHGPLGQSWSARWFSAKKAVIYSVRSPFTSLFQDLGAVCSSCCVNATHFLLRGKCNVTLLNETDVLAGYLDKEVRLLQQLFIMVWVLHVIKRQTVM